MSGPDASRFTFDENELRPYTGEQRPLADSRIVLLPIPFEKTTTFLKGTRRGPAALLAASAQMETWDEELGAEVLSLGIHTAPPVAGSAPTPEAMVTEVEAAVLRYLEQDRFVVGIGGEHSISFPIVRAFRKKFPDCGVIQFDAHGDLRDSYEGSPHNHACVARRIIDIAPFLHVGLRSCCAEEAGIIRSRGIPVIPSEQFIHRPESALEALSKLPDQVFVTIDLDFFDPSVVPGVGTPEPGGAGWYETLRFLREIAGRKTIVGFDVMELCPRPGEVISEFLASKLIYRLLGYTHLPRQAG
jgi:agmatinase